MSERALRRLGAKVAPLSFAQERLWFIDAVAPLSPIYNVPLYFRRHGEVNIEVLRRALLAVIEKHEVLRTTYEVRDGERVQVIGEPRIAVDVVDHDPVIEARRGFDLATGPPVRCAVWRGQPDGDAVLLTIHHIAVDGWSLATLFADLGAAYEIALTGRRPQLPEPPVQYADFAAWDRETLDQRMLAKRVEELSAVPAGLELGGARPVPDGVHPGVQHRFGIPGDTYRAVGRLATKLRATPFVVLLSAYADVLGRWSGRDEFLVGVVTANRTRPETENLVGFFVNTVPLRCAARERTFAERCARMRGEAFRSMTYQRIPYDRLVADSPGRGLVDVGFALQNMPAPEVAGWTPPEVLPTGTAKFDVLLVIDETPNGVSGTVEYDTDRYPVELGPRLAEDFVALLGHVVTTPDAPLHDYQLPYGPLARPRPHLAPAVQPDTAVRHDTALQPDTGELTDHENQAAELFRAVLTEIGAGAVDLGKGSNFFVAGGHSLMAVTMLALAQRRHGVVVRPSEFLAEPTVARLGALLEAGERTVEPVAALQEGLYPATSTQQRFWFLDRIPELRAAYLVPTVIDIPDDIGVEAIRAALDVVLARHPALRSRFRLDRKQKRVVYTTTASPARATVTDARGWDTRKVHDHVAEVCWTPFDLADEAPVRVELVLLPGSVRLVVCAHHMVLDGASVRILLEQVDAVIGGRALPEAVHPASVGHPSADPADLIAVLRGAPTDVWLPRDRPRGDTQAILGATFTTTLDRGVVAALRAVAAESGCSTFQVTAALLAVTLAQRGDQRDFLFAFPWSGRDHRSSAVGMFVNTLLLRLDLRHSPTWQELLGRVREASAAAYRAAEVPFDAVVAALHPERDLRRPPITPVYVASGDEWQPPLHGRQLPLDPLAVKYELELTATETTTDLRLTIAYQVDMFDEATVRRLLTECAAAATALVTGPTAPACEEN